MLFHSPEFLLMFLPYLAGMVLLSARFRPAFTLLASYLFYAWWYPPYLLLIILLTLLAYFAAFFVARSKLFFVLSLCAALLPLVFYKYASFILSNLVGLLGLTGVALPQFALPIGLSFISFTILSYLIDVRHSRVSVERSLPQLALFIAFFPHLIAGPIVRVRELLPQLSVLRFQSSMLRPAILLFTVGILKKVGFADQISGLVATAYADVSHNAFLALCAFYGFAVQIYCDFSGYTDMAIALAMLISVRLPRNFDSPYTAPTLRQFWRRWHMTLSRWLRDYLYIPLGGSRSGAFGTAMALLVTMGLGGLWHGANWTFVLWGLYHGALLAAEHFVGRISALANLVLPIWIKRFITFHLVCLGWVLFRSPDLATVGGYFSALTSGVWATDIVTNQFPLALALIPVALLVHPWDVQSRLRLAAKRLPAVALTTGCILTIAIVAAASLGNPSAFIYFDF